MPRKEMAGEASARATRSRRGRGGRGATDSGDEDGMTEYEKQRLSTIKENQAKLQALGLPGLASFLLGSSSACRERGHSTEEAKVDSRKRRQSKKRRDDDDDDDDDDEYQPSGEGEPGESSSSGEEKMEEEEEGRVSSLGARRTPGGKGRKKNSSTVVKARKKLSIRQMMDDLDAMDDDAALQQAIVISLGEPMKSSGAEVNMGSHISSGPTTSAEHPGKNDGNGIRETTGGKRRKGNVKRPQMTEDELVAYFFSFDEAGKGSIMLHDLMRMAVAHDFRWTEQEMADMIYLFDSNRDGKLSLDDFRTIVSRCNMVWESGNS